MAELGGASATSQRRPSPATARRHLAGSYLRLRKASGYTQQSAARALGWSIRKQQLLESGDQVIAERELAVFLPGLGVPRGEWPGWRELAATAHEPGWWDAYDDEELSPIGKRFVGLEHGTTRIRTFSALLIPGLLQTPGYRTAILTGASLVTRAAEQVSVLIEVARRRQQVLDDPDPVELWAVLDESALHRAGGTREVMREQLAHMADLAASRPSVTVQVIPFGAGLHAGLAGSFSLMECGWPGDPGFVYVEAIADRPTYLEGRGDLFAFSRVFDRLVTIALPADESLEMLRDLAGHPPGP